MNNLKEGFDGNHFDKYSSKNIFVKLIMKNFTLCLLDLINTFDNKNFFDLGCGDGHWMNYFSQKGFFVRGGDHSDKQLKIIKEKYNFDGYKIDLYNSSFVNEMNKILTNEKINNILFSEVLEHLENPDQILHIISKLNFKNLVITVPNEPLWRLLNLMRGKYLRQLGNTPGHINHFSKTSLERLLNKIGFKIDNIKISQPFLLYKCSK
jgi:2-polyprenyl-3-methyl-5-hydroxy-6-metoxy-1,4-benzoquinol methylase